MKETETQKILQAGKIASEVSQYAKKLIKPNTPLLEIAEKIEAKIIELGGKPAFPCNLSINDIAAHYTPSHDDKTLAHGLLKVDFGVHVDGFISDTAFSVDLENNEENKNLIKASEQALKNALEKIKTEKNAGKIGSIINETIEKYGFSPIINLSGHSMESYELHSGITIPNIDDKRNVALDAGLYAIEPFATAGSGKVYDGKPSGIYFLKSRKPARNPLARQIQDFIEEEYKTLPFCSRWLVKKFGAGVLFALKELETSGALHQFEQLVEISHAKVSQAEHTILIDKDEVIMTTG